jgi:hypothetical protein
MRSHRVAAGAIPQPGCPCQTVNLSTPGLDPVASIFATGDEHTSGWISMIDGKLVNPLATKTRIGDGLDSSEVR